MCIGEYHHEGGEEVVEVGHVTVGVSEALGAMEISGALQQATADLGDGEVRGLLDSVVRGETPILELPLEELDACDGENEKEEHEDDDGVDEVGDGREERGKQHLQRADRTDRPERPQHSQTPERLEVERRV